MGGENKHFDTVLTGRNTYEPGLEIGLSSPYPTLKQYVFSVTMGESPHESVTLVSWDAAGLVRRLKSEPGKDIWLAGGAALAGTGRRADAQGEPPGAWEGRPALLRGYEEIDLDLEDSSMFAGGGALLGYE